MASFSMSWLDPKAIDSAKSLEWIAKSIAKGKLQGRHRSQRLSNGYEFSQYRPYVQGDDLRLIDWKMYGKTDKYYIKQSEVEQDHDLHVIVDNSKSMDYEEDGWSKLMYAKLLTACISYINLNQGDSFSWSSSGINHPTGFGMTHWKNCIHAIHKLNSAPDIKESILKVERNKVYIWLTDLYEDVNDISNVLHSLKHANTEVIIFHIIGEKEQSLDFPNNATFIDLESGDKIQLNPTDYVSEYQSKREAHIKACKELFYSKAVQYHKAYINHPVENTIKLFLDSYNKCFL